MVTVELPPLHAIGVEAEEVTKAVGSGIVKVDAALHPFASVIV